MYQKLWVVVVVLILSACSQHIEPTGPQAPTKTPDIQPPPVREPVTEMPQIVLPPKEEEMVPLPPKVLSFDWTLSFSPLVDQMVTAGGMTRSSLLLLDGVRNGTNRSLPISAATTALYNAFGTSSPFKVVPFATLTQASRTMGLSDDDSLASRGKAIGLARHVKAQYVLYTTLTEQDKTLQINMQAMLVQSGEIVWSGKGLVQMEEQTQEQPTIEQALPVLDDVGGWW